MKMGVNDVMIKTPMRGGFDVLQTVLNLMSLCIKTSNVNSKKEKVELTRQGLDKNLHG
jgi:hypothetical protein